MVYYIINYFNNMLCMLFYPFLPKTMFLLSISPINIHSVSYIHILLLNNNVSTINKNILVPIISILYYNNYILSFNNIISIYYLYTIPLLFLSFTSCFDGITHYFNNIPYILYYIYCINRINL